MWRKSISRSQPLSSCANFRSLVSASGRYCSVLKTRRICVLWRPKNKKKERNNILRKVDANNSSYNYCVEVDKITFENCLPCPTKSTLILTRSHFEVLLIAHSLLLRPSYTNNFLQFIQITFLQFGQIHFAIKTKLFCN